MVNKPLLVWEQQGVPADFIWLIAYLFSEILGNPNNSDIINDIDNVRARKAKDFSEKRK